MKKRRVSLSEALAFVGLFLLLGIFIGDLINLAIFDVSFTNKLVSIGLKDEQDFVVTKEVCEEVEKEGYFEVMRICRSNCYDLDDKYKNFTFTECLEDCRVNIDNVMKEEICNDEEVDEVERKVISSEWLHKCVVSLPNTSFFIGIEGVEMIEEISIGGMTINSSCKGIDKFSIEKKLVSDLTYQWIYDSCDNGLNKNYWKCGDYEVRRKENA